jgi:hypothetical protein
VLGAALVLLLVGAFIGVGVLAGGDAATHWVPIASLCIALLSLVVASSTAIGNARRQKVMATMEAWIAWSDGSQEDRRQVTALFGTAPLTAAQARALIEGGPCLDAHGQPMTEDRRKQALRTIVRLLNGLERIAAGVDLGTYDVATLNTMGGTIIARTFYRFRPYIQLRRTTPIDPLRQRDAFTRLEALTSEIERLSTVDRRRYATDIGS